MKTQETGILTAILIGVGILLGVGLGAYLSKEAPKTKANFDTFCVLETTQDCTSGSWSQWNLTDEAMIDLTSRLIIPPHSRIYIGVTRAERSTWAWTAEDCLNGTGGTGVFGSDGRWLRDENGNVVNSEAGEAGELIGGGSTGPSICAMEQQDLTDPETNVTTLNEEPGCTGTECDIPPSF